MLRIGSRAKLKDLRGDVIVARAALRKHVSQTELESHGKRYVAKGDWNLLGMLGFDIRASLHGLYGLQNPIKKEEIVAA